MKPVRDDIEREYYDSYKRWEKYECDPLTPEEKRWIKAVEKLLMKTPKRFGLYTVGDPCIHIFDKCRCEELGIPQEECNPSSNGLDLGIIRSSEGIQGWCG